jgi:hypothetical protein
VSSTPPEPNYSWQPQPANFKSAPPYGQPPRKSRAGLIIGLIVLLIFVAIGAIGVLAYRLVANHQHSKSDPAPSRSAAPPPATKSTRVIPAKPAPTTPARPSTAPKTTTAVTTVADLGRRFVAQLNANNSQGAATYACKGATVTGDLVITQLAPDPICVRAFTITSKTTSG